MQELFKKMTEGQYNWSRVKKGESERVKEEKQYISKVYWSKPTLVYISKMKFLEGYWGLTGLVKRLPNREDSGNSKGLQSKKCRNWNGQACVLSLG